jgi:hypothetical protein
MLHLSPHSIIQQGTAGLCFSGVLMVMGGSLCRSPSTMRQGFWMWGIPLLLHVLLSAI